MKQAIVVRKDLEMGKGKLAAQVAHAAVEAADRSKWKREWMTEGQKKTVLRCDTEEALINLFEEAKRAGLPVALIRDAGHTQLPENTVTCLGIGPAPDDMLDKVTGKLKLL